MPDISNYYSGGGNYLKAAELEDDITVTIEGERQYTFPNDNKPTLFLKLAGMDKEFRCGARNVKRIAEMYGWNTDDWLGKQIPLMPDVTQDPQGKEVPTIVVKVRKTARNAPKAAAKYDDRNPPPPLDDEIPF